MESSEGVKVAVGSPRTSLRRRMVLCLLSLGILVFGATTHVVAGSADEGRLETVPRPDVPLGWWGDHPNRILERLAEPSREESLEVRGGRLIVESDSLLVWRGRASRGESLEHVWVFESGRLAAWMAIRRGESPGVLRGFGLTLFARRAAGFVEELERVGARGLSRPPPGLSLNPDPESGALRWQSEGAIGSTRLKVAAEVSGRFWTLSQMRSVPEERDARAARLLTLAEETCPPLERSHRPDRSNSLETGAWRSWTVCAGLRAGEADPLTPEGPPPPAAALELTWDLCRAPWASRRAEVRRLTADAPNSWFRSFEARDDSLLWRIDLRGEADPGAVARSRPDDRPTRRWLFCLSETDRGLLAALEVLDLGSFPGEDGAPRLEAVRSAAAWLSRSFGSPKSWQEIWTFRPERLDDATRLAALRTGRLELQGEWETPAEARSLSVRRLSIEGRDQPIAVLHAGWSMDPLYRVAARRGLAVLLDCLKTLPADPQAEMMHCSALSPAKPSD